MFKHIKAESVWTRKLVQTHLQAAELHTALGAMNKASQYSQVRDHLVATLQQPFSLSLTQFCGVLSHQRYCLFHNVKPEYWRLLKVSWDLLPDSNNYFSPQLSCCLRTFCSVCPDTLFFLFSLPWFLFPYPTSCNFKHIGIWSRVVVVVYHLTEYSSKLPIFLHDRNHMVSLTRSVPNLHFCQTRKITLPLQFLK